jgi:hypothetical protein
MHDDDCARVFVIAIMRFLAVFFVCRRARAMRMGLRIRVDSGD